MVIEHSKQRRYEEVLDDEDEIELWQPKARDRRLDDAYTGMERDEC